METIKFADGRVFGELPACSFGDYSGSGCVGKANVQVLKDKYPWEYKSYSDCSYQYCSPKELTNDGWEDIVLEPETVLLVLYCSHNHESCYMDVEHGDYEGLVDSLNDYCCLDERYQETEDKLESWDGWIRSDLYRSLESDFELNYECADDQDDPWYSETWLKFEALWDSTEDSTSFHFFEQYCNDRNCYIEEDGYSGFTLSWPDLSDFITEYLAEFSAE